MLCVSGAVFCSILENACAICCVACSIICDMDRICCWVGNVACILLFGAGWWWERFGDGRMLLDGLFCQFYQLLHFLFHLVLVGGGNVLAMVGCSWMACSVNSTSCYISSVPWVLLISLWFISLVCVLILIPYTYGDFCNPHIHTGIDLDPRMHTGDCMSSRPLGLSFVFPAN